MNTLTCLCLFLCISLIGPFVGAFETVKTSPSSDATNFPFIPYAGSASSGPYIIAAGLYKNTSDWVINVQKRNASGYYAQIAQLEPVPATLSLSTNGKWFASYFMMNGTAVVFQLVNDAITDIHYINEQDSSIQLLSDDSLLFIADGTVITYAPSTDGQTWSVVDRSTLKNFSRVSFLALVHITDTTLAYVGNDTVAYLYVRSDSDKSWQLKYSIPLGSGPEAYFNIAWNGGDTVIVGIIDTSGEALGAISLYQLTGNSYNFIHNFTVDELGVKPIGYLGMSMALIDNDTFVVSAPLDGVTSVYAGGSAFVLHRKSGTWSVAAKLESSEADIYALGVTSNDLHILLYSCQVVIPGKESYCSHHALARCFDAPIDVTCKDVKLDSCASVSSVDISTVYTINNPLCGNVDVNLKSLSAVGETIDLTLEFTRSFADSVSCDAKVTCSNLVVSSAGQNLVNAILALFLISVVLLI